MNPSYYPPKTQQNTFQGNSRPFYKPESPQDYHTIPTTTHFTTNSQPYQGSFLPQKIGLTIYFLVGALTLWIRVDDYIRHGDIDFENPLVHILGIILTTISLVLVIFQSVAIDKKSLKIAKVSLAGFTIYLILDLIYFFGSFRTVIYGYTWLEIGLFIVLVLPGSITVFLALKKHHQSTAGNYQNSNYTRDNGTLP